MKKIIKNNIFGFILGILLCSGIVYGANVYQSNAIQYSSTDSSWNVSNVSEAINSLHSMTKELETIKNIGDATAAQILSGKKAVVKGSTITGTMPNRNSWTSTPTSNGKVTIPAGYHNGSGYVDTTTVYSNGYNDGITVGKGDAQYKIDITITCYFSGYNGYSITGYADDGGAKSTRTHTIYIRSLDDISYKNLNLRTIYGGGHRNGNPSTYGTPAAFYVIDAISITKLT